MTIWQLIIDTSNFRQLRFVKDVDERYFDDAGVSFRPKYKPVPVTFEFKDDDKIPHNELTVGDFGVFFLSWLVVSHKALNILEAFAKDKLEIFPVISDEPNGPFYIVNLNNTLNCIDFEKSEIAEKPLFMFKSQTGPYLKVPYIKRYVFRDNCLDDQHIFRLDQIVGSKISAYPIFVSDELKLAVESNHLQGVTFRQITDVTLDE